ncbi:MAG: serine/threonine protein kinase [Myxococcales bacterium]|nr:serine/threonine protein kinase [Myxococcales bacterium]
MSSAPPKSEEPESKGVERGGRRVAPRFVGSRLGKYHVGARLAAGGAASVYLARLSGPHNFERLLALKIIHEHLAEEQEFVDMFLDEANLASRLAHPNVVHVFELAREDDVLFMAMEYLHGQPLSQVYRRFTENGEPIPLDLVAWLGARAADGLHHAHELCDEHGHRLGLVHRDVSPQNVIVTYDGQVKVVDFGIARADGRLAQTALGQIKGKFSYMAPEQALGKPYDHRADLFALGATLYELAMGRRLFRGEDEMETLRKVIAAEVPSPRGIDPSFPLALETILLRVLALDPERRHASANELARDLDAFAAAGGAKDHAERLGELVTEAFSDERAKQEAALSRLREATLVESVGQHPSLPSDSTQLNSGLDRLARETVTPEPRRPSKYWIGLALAAVVAIFVLVSTRKGPTSGAQTREVAVEVTWTPAIPASVTIDGQRVDGIPAVTHLPRENRNVSVKIIAEGYEPTELLVVPDRDRSVLLRLTEQRVSPPETPRSPMDEAPSAAPSGAEDKPAAKKRWHGKAPEPASTTPKSKVIDQNPF